MKSIFVTGIGGDLAQGVARIIKESFPNIHLLGSDIHERHGGKLFVDEFLLVPPAGEGYLDAIRSAIQTFSIEAFLPLTEGEIRESQPLGEELGQRRYISPGKRAVEVGLDKLTTIEMLRKIGLTVPWTRPVKNGAPPEYPCIIKDRFGSGSRGVSLVRDQREAYWLIEHRPEAIFQEFLTPCDKEVTCSVYRSKNGGVISLLMLRQLTGGVTSWAQVIRDQKIEETCRSIADELDLRGSMNVQLRVTEKGPRIFEINPRFSSTVLMRHRLGFSDVIWTIKEIEDEVIEFPVISSGQVMIRTQDAVLIS